MNNKSSHFDLNSVNVYEVNRDSVAKVIGSPINDFRFTGASSAFQRALSRAARNLSEGLANSAKSTPVSKVAKESLPLVADVVGPAAEAATAVAKSAPPRILRRVFKYAGPVGMVAVGALTIHDAEAQAAEGDMLGAAYTASDLVPSPFLDAVKTGFDAGYAWGTVIQTLERKVQDEAWRQSEEQGLQTPKLFCL